MPRLKRLKGKAAERATRSALGPRLSRSPSAPLQVTAPPRIPRATGAPGPAIRNTLDNR